MLAAAYKKPEGEPPDYFVKWENLPYSEATWEDGKLVEKKWAKKVKEFREREDSKRTPSKHCRALKSRPKFQQIKSQPDYMGGDQVIILIHIRQADSINILGFLSFSIINYMHLCLKVFLVSFFFFLV
jgi:chromodomain-helicase-DNA-binding protein 1